MAVEYNPNDYGHTTPGQNTVPNSGQNHGQNPGHGQYPVQGQPAPYNPHPGQAAPQHPPGYHYPDQRPHVQHPNGQQPVPYPGQAYEHPSAQGYIPPQPGPQFQTPGEAHPSQNEKPKSRFRLGGKTKAANQPSAKKIREKNERTSSSLRPFLMGLVTGSVLTFAGLVFMGNQAKKTLQADFDRVAAQVQPTADIVILGEDGTLPEETIVAETTTEQPE